MPNRLQISSNELVHFKISIFSSSNFSNLQIEPFLIGTKRLYANENSLPIDSVQRTGLEII